MEYACLALARFRYETYYESYSDYVQLTVDYDMK